MSAKVEPVRNAGFILSEAPGSLSRDQGVLAQGNNLVAGAVLGQITLGAATVAAAGAGEAGANTGDGTLVMDATTPLLAGAQVGTYQVRVITAATNGGTFRVWDPSGNVIGDAVISGGAGGTAAFANQIKFVLTDGGTDFAATDGFTVTVAAGNGRYAEYDPAALNGTGAPAGVLYIATDATAANTNCTVVTRLAEVVAARLVWEDDVTDGEKVAAIAALAHRNIIAR